MNYRKHYFTPYNIEAEISSFEPKGKVAEYNVMLHIDNKNEPYEEQLNKLHAAYKELITLDVFKNATPVFKRYFLSDAANQTEMLQHVLTAFEPCAISIVQQPPLDGSKIALWVYFQTDITVLPGDNFAVTHNGYTHYWDASLCVASGNSENQTTQLLQNYENYLDSQQCNIKDNCIRTWFFVQNVDVNYAGVVKARKENFIAQGMTEKTHYIASTGIEGRHANPNVHVLLDTYAVKGHKPEQMKHLYAPTHLNPTYEYGVTFERGVVMEYGDRKQLYISGTASIDNKGVVVHVGDVIAQTQRMCENVGKLLEEGGATFNDVAKMIVYLRDVGDYSNVKHVFEERFPDIPKVIVLAPVCRPLWLIEVECVAIKENNSGYKEF
ncbi:Rid family hydrolase [Bacteroides sp. 519]|uniref:Rid family hydrolase n=1 Tax=Bacteroides sp. 519 TaxID=2302937 RepID=UPI0013D10F11|nr:Rid family hydrolase [Bacteroides sp. 519]NDV58656.1 hypothetical protein [Bacteroides sp. 519]